MKLVLLLAMFFGGMSVSKAQSWHPLNGLVCTLEGRSSILLQQTDENGQAIPFDCKSTDIKVFTGERLVNHIKPGFHYLCDLISDEKYKNHQLRTSPLGVLGGNKEGVYDVLVQRGEETLRFEGLELKKNPEDKCWVIPITVEVQFKK